MLQARGLDEEDVGAGFPVQLGPLEGGFQPLKRQRVGASDEDEILVRPRIRRGLDLGDHVPRGNQLLAGEMATALRQHLILEVDCRDAGAFVELHGAAHVERAAIAVIGIGDHRDVADGRDACRVVDHLGQRQQADIRHAEPRGGGAGARHVHRLVAVLRDEAREERIDDAGRHDRAAAREQMAELVVVLMDVGPLIKMASIIRPAQYQSPR